jgi:hypothetical protein
MNLKWIQSLRHIRATALAGSIAVVTLISGCTVGPALYETSFTQYNEAVRKTLDEQMLANLVRMRYYQSPVFLQVSSLNASFSVGANAGVTGTFPSGGSNTGGASLGGSYSESPTISFSMPESREYYGRMLAPLSADQITSLVLAGYDSELVLRTSARGLNRLRNVTAEHSDAPMETASNAQFREVLVLIKKLRAEGIVQLELGAKAAMWSSPVEVDVSEDRAKTFLLREVLHAMANGSEIVRGDDGLWQAYMFERHMALQFAPAANDSADAARLRELLGLEPGRNAFPIVEPELVNTEKPKTVMGLSPGALDPDVVWAEIGMRGRSMLEIMQVASKAVQAPDKDVERGVVSANQSPAQRSVDDATDWLVIRSSDSEPSDNTLSINYRGHWFYIDDADLQSRETFSMLNALFAVVGGTVPGAHPVLTLPVK